MHDADDGNSGSYSLLTSEGATFVELFREKSCPPPPPRKLHFLCLVYFSFASGFLNGSSSLLSCTMITTPKLPSTIRVFFLSFSVYGGDFETHIMYLVSYLVRGQ